jgi:hypothetical protein
LCYNNTMPDEILTALETIDQAWDDVSLAPYLTQCRLRLIDWLKIQMQSELDRLGVDPGSLSMAAKDIIYLNPTFHRLVGSTLIDDYEDVRDGLRKNSVPVEEAERTCTELMSAAVTQLADVLTKKDGDLRHWRPTDSM